MQAWTMARQLSPLGPGRDRISAVVRQIAAHWLFRSMQRLSAAGSSSCRQASEQLAQVDAQALAASIAARSGPRSNESFFGCVSKMSISRPYGVRPDSSSAHVGSVGRRVRSFREAAEPVERVLAAGDAELERSPLELGDVSQVVGDVDVPDLLAELRQLAQLVLDGGADAVQHAPAVRGVQQPEEVEPR